MRAVLDTCRSTVASGDGTKHCGCGSQHDLGRARGRLGRGHPRAPGSPRPTAPSGRRGATTTPTGRRPRPCCCGATAADREPRRVFRGPCSPKPPSRTSPRPCPDGSDLDRQARRWEERPPHVPDAIWLNQVRPVPRAIGGERLRMPPHEGAGRPCRSPGGSSAGTMDVQTPVCLLYI